MPGWFQECLHQEALGTARKHQGVTDERGCGGPSSYLKSSQANPVLKHNCRLTLKTVSPTHSHRTPVSVSLPSVKQEVEPWHRKYCFQVVTDNVEESTQLMLRASTPEAQSSYCVRAGWLSKPVTPSVLWRVGRTWTLDTTHNRGGQGRLAELPRAPLCLFCFTPECGWKTQRRPHCYK